MKRIAYLLLLLSLFGLTACSLTTPAPVFNNINLNNVDMTKVTKVGEDCETYVLGFGPFGDRSIVKASRQGGITFIDLVEYRDSWFLIGTSKCVQVHGH